MYRYRCRCRYIDINRCAVETTLTFKPKKAALAARGIFASCPGHRYRYRYIKVYIDIDIDKYIESYPLTLNSKPNPKKAALGARAYGQLSRSYIYIYILIDRKINRYKDIDRY